MESKKTALLYLKKQYEMIQNSDLNVSVGLENDDFFKWRVCFEGPPGTPFQEGLYQAMLAFPNDYPNMPPKMTFTTEMFHPNIFPNGDVCISILHAPEKDEFNPQEEVSEKWKPVLTVESILISVISMLVSPNLESPANVDASIMYRNDRQGYDKKLKQLAKKSVEQ